MSAARDWVSNRGGSIGFFVFGGCGVPLFLWVWGLWWGVSGPSGWWGGLVCAGGGIIRVFYLGGVVPIWVLFLLCMISSCSW